MTERKIVTRHIYPPIPDRSSDWVAYYEGCDEFGSRGFGPTEQAAIDDLTDNFPDDSAKVLPC